MQEVKKDIQEQPKIEKEKKKTQTKKETVTIDTPKQNFIERNISGISAASPKARKFARELGVNINQIFGSERQGRVIENDIKNFISSKINKLSEIKELK